MFLDIDVDMFIEPEYNHRVLLSSHYIEIVAND